MNTERGIMRKVSTVKSFYNYFYRTERIQNMDRIIVVDPMGEYAPLVRRLGGRCSRRSR